MYVSCGFVFFFNPGGEIALFVRECSQHLDHGTIHHVVGAAHVVVFGSRVLVDRQELDALSLRISWTGQRRAQTTS